MTRDDATSLPSRAGDPPRRRHPDTRSSTRRGRACGRWTARRPGHELHRGGPARRRRGDAAPARRARVAHPDESLDHLDALLLAGGADLDAGDLRRAAASADGEPAPAARRVRARARVRRARARHAGARRVPRDADPQRRARGHAAPARPRAHRPRGPPPDHRARSATTTSASRHRLARRARGGRCPHPDEVAPPPGRRRGRRRPAGDGLGEEDDLPEAIELPGARYALGVQWHPEADDASSVVIASLVDEARVARARGLTEDGDRRGRRAHAATPGTPSRRTRRRRPERGRGDRGRRRGRGRVRTPTHRRSCCAASSASAPRRRILATPVVLPDTDVVFSAHVSHHGAIPATIVPWPGTEVDAWLLAVPPARDRRARRDRAQLRARAPRRDRAHAYVSRHGPAAGRRARRSRSPTSPRAGARCAR